MLYYLFSVEINGLGVLSFFSVVVVEVCSFLVLLLVVVCSAYFFWCLCVLRFFFCDIALLSVGRYVFIFSKCFNCMWVVLVFLSLVVLVVWV